VSAPPLPWWWLVVAGGGWWYVRVWRKKQDRAIHSKFTIPMDEFVRGDLRDAKVPPPTSRHHIPAALFSPT
jgi:hypothetical protein